MISKASSGSINTVCPVAELIMDKSSHYAYSLAHGITKRARIATVICASLSRKSQSFLSTWLFEHAAPITLRQASLLIDDLTNESIEVFSQRLALLNIALLHRDQYRNQLTEEGKDPIK